MSAQYTPFSQLKDARQQIISLGEKAPSSQAYKHTLIDRLRTQVSFDAACCTSIDPHTLLSTGAFTESGVDGIHYKLLEYEYLRNDVMKYDQLVRDGQSIATLNGATGGHLIRSARYRDVLQPAGFGDELRVPLMYKGSCWGFLTLFRLHTEPVFSEEEQQLLEALAPSIAYHLRQASVGLSPDSGITMENDMEPGVLVLSGKLEPISSNPTADRWLKLLRQQEGIDENSLPAPVRAVCFRALSTALPLGGQIGGELGRPLSNDRRVASPAKLCIPAADAGTPWVTLRATLLQSRQSKDEKQLAVWFEPAKASEMLPLMAEMFAWSERERQIVRLIVQGFSTRELASALHISAYTVQDHLKAIFLKTGVSSRRELVWKVYSRFN
ncbi:LuxR C-terminal-related transcriptional regulator [Paenibacillus terrae]|uniref:DNA-binding protein n=1 Tax=Paenibacillus terrae (strain HPL-003) TaxID=985665 RepID=G7VXN3_PAETH|nr:LuxR C-terminal-related transcriptional regulator [Paenibacillus terrae]AET59793.1 DNA-binding protein [Paenibacillus terrae HPL-003]